MADTNNCGNNSVCGPVKTADCFTPFQLSTSGDSCVISQYVNESLLIAGADINVFKLLGIHQQGKLTDLTGRGKAIASSSQPTYDSAHVFDIGCGEWRSIERGNDVVAKSFIGYDFGEIKLDNGRDQYGINTFVQYHITTIRIQQGDNANNRATAARVEYSSDGMLWKGAAIVQLPDNNQGNLIHFKQSTPSKFWRIRPLAFNGGPNDYWVVQNLQLIDLSALSLDNIQDEWGFLENRDRQYAQSSVLLKGSYDMTDISSFLARFGMETTDEFTLRFHFLSMVASLGRPLVIGDIIEIPSQIQYGPDMTPVRKYMEVTQTAWDTNGFTPGWTPTILRVVAAPMLAKQETMDIVGDFADDVDPMGFKKNNPQIFSGLAGILNEKIDSAARSQVPERGEDDTHKPIIPNEVVVAAESLGADVMQLVKYETNPGYVLDGMPPGGAPYTEGDTMPEKPKDGDYHRLTYVNIGQNIPPRLYRFSLKKNRWIYLETDERMNDTVNSMKISQFLNSSTRKNINEVM